MRKAQLLSVIILPLLLAGFLGTKTRFATGQVQPATVAGTFPVAIRVNASQTTGDMRPIWRFFGADEPNYAYWENGKKLLTELGQLSGRTAYFRTHKLLVLEWGTPRSR